MKTENPASRMSKSIVALFVSVFLVLSLWAMPVAADSVVRLAADVTVRFEAAPETFLPPETVQLLEALGLHIRFSDIESGGDAPAFVVNVDLLRDLNEIVSIDILQDRETILSVPRLLDEPIKIDLKQILDHSENKDAFFPLSLAIFDLPGIVRTVESLLQWINDYLPERVEAGTIIVSAGGFEREYRVETQAIEGEDARTALLDLIDVLEQDELFTSFIISFLLHHMDDERIKLPDKMNENAFRQTKDYINSEESFDNVAIALDSYYDESGTLQGGSFRLSDVTNSSGISYSRVSVAEGDMRYTDHAVSLPDQTGGRIEFALSSGDSEESISGSFRLVCGPAGSENEVASGTVTDLSMVPYSSDGLRFPVGRIELEIFQTEELPVKLSIASAVLDDHIEARIDIDRIGAVFLTWKELDEADLVILDPTAENMHEVSSQEEFHALFEQVHVSEKLLNF